jgi:hypothetical protein
MARLSTGADFPLQFPPATMLQGTQVLAHRRGCRAIADHQDLVTTRLQPLGVEGYHTYAASKIIGGSQDRDTHSISPF